MDSERSGQLSNFSALGYRSPARRHQNGAVLVFADSHAECWKWKGAAAVSWFNGGYVTDPVELQDLKRLQQTAPDVE